MNLARYFELRREQIQPSRSIRVICRQCRRASSACYCEKVSAFYPGIKISFLVHPKEAANRIGTARLAHRFLLQSSWIEGRGADFDSHPVVRSWAGKPPGDDWILFPGPRALDLSSPSAHFKPKNIILIDGTWSLARKMIQRSQVLSSLPQIMYYPERPSSYRIRQQPGKICLSTIEAVHGVLSRINPTDRSAERLLLAFNWMVEHQIQCEESKRSRQRTSPGII